MSRWICICGFMLTICSAKVLDMEPEKNVHLSVSVQPPSNDSISGGELPSTNVPTPRQIYRPCSSVCVHRLHSAVGCDFYRLRERIPHLYLCFTGQARQCDKSYVSYCWNQDNAKALSIAEPRCDNDGFTCGDLTVSKEDLREMDCKCSIKCDETCQ